MRRLASETLKWRRFRLMKKDEWIRRLKNWGERKDRLLIAFLFGVLLLVIAIPVERGRKG